MKLYQYKGGGYDGCFWEWNFFLIDNENNFVDIYSSGSQGVSSLIEAQKIINSANFQEQYIYMYDLNNEESIKEFEEENNSTNVGKVCDLVNTYLEKEVMFFHCSYCKEKVYPINYDDYPSYFHDEQNYSGNGGIGIVYHSCICEECYSNRCDKCESIIQPDEEVTEVKEQYLCKYCYEEGTS